MQWTILKLLQWSEAFLRGKGVDSPRLDSELLLGRVLELARVQLYTQFDRPLVEGELGAFKALLTRRAAREPLAYILGEKEFFSLRFHVGPAVLIPRPETEGLVERGLAHLKSLRQQGEREGHVLDLATGSGCILIALLVNSPEARGIGLDVNAAALETAKRNAADYGLSERAQWTYQDLSGPWEGGFSKPFHLITANLPYVSAQEWEGLSPEIRDFEPRMALTPGPLGSEAFSWVLPKLPLLLSPTGVALFEIGMDQGKEVLELAGRLCPTLLAEVDPDLSGKDRILKCIWPSARV